jgi:uncharacterized SAM-binding protein YcdF (DUF218 family)
MARCESRTKFLICIGFFCVAIGVWGIGFLHFVSEIPKEMQDDIYLVDAVVVLTGGSKRLETGFELLARGRASIMFISGVNKEVELRDLFAMEAGYDESLLDRVETGHGAKNTAENAREVSDWMSKRGFKSLYLVTATYHMPRSLDEFNYSMNGVEIIPYPVFPKSVRISDWWQWPGTTALLIGEYVKVLASSIRHVVARVGNSGS